MENFITIAEAKNAKKGNFKGIIIKAGDLKSGTSDRGDWTLKVYTVEDVSGQIEFCTWNEDYKLYIIGHTYEFLKPWYKEKDGKVSIQKSDYGEIKEVKGAPAAAPAQANVKVLLPTMNPNMADKVAQDTVLLMQIEQVVRETMSEFVKGTPPDPQVGMYVKEIFKDLLNVLPTGSVTTSEK